MHGRLMSFAGCCLPFSNRRLAARRLTLVGGILSFALTSCVSSEAPVQNCERFEEKIDDDCREVVVTGLSEEDVVFENGALSLRGTLTLPETEGDYQAPAFVLVHGSGPQHRDLESSGTLGIQWQTPFKVYEELAHRLAERGIASLRYDKRTCFSENNDACETSFRDYPGDLDAIVVDDYLEDARVAIQRLQESPAVNPAEILIIGHSQGGNFVAQIAGSEAGVIGGIGLATPAGNLESALVGQIIAFRDHLFSLNPALYQNDIEQLDALATQYENELPSVIDGSWPDANYQGASLAFWQSWHDVMEDTETQVKRSGKPLLYLNGDWDFNVPPENLEQFASWAGDADASVETLLLPGLTHSFNAIEGVPPADFTAEARVSESTIDAIFTWIKELETE